MALVIVTAPKPPGSGASISPPAAVFEMAPAKVLHGAVRLQGLASSPTPDTHVRVAWAWAIEATPTVIARIEKYKTTLFMTRSRKAMDIMALGLDDFATTVSG